MAYGIAVYDSYFHPYRLSQCFLKMSLFHSIVGKIHGLNAPIIELFSEAMSNAVVGGLGGF